MERQNVLVQLATPPLHAPPTATREVRADLLWCAAQEAKQALLRGVGAHAADDSCVRFTRAAASTIRRPGR